MMEPFLMYVIICVASTGGCNDYAPPKAWAFRSKEECEVFVDKVYIAFIKDMKEKGQIVVDGKAFCLRYRETKEI